MADEIVLTPKQIVAKAWADELCSTDTEAAIASAIRAAVEREISLERKATALIVERIERETSRLREVAAAWREYAEALQAGAPWARPQPFDGMPRVITNAQIRKMADARASLIALGEIEETT